MDELLDLVNEKDVVIGEVWKSQAHKNNKIIHREIGILIHNKNNEVLLQQRSLLKKTAPGYWTVACAGHVGNGELPERASHRELKEELGFDVNIIFFKKVYEIQPTESRFMYLYTGEYNDDKIVIQKEEVEKAMFFTKDEFVKLLETKMVEPISANWCKEFWGIK